MSDAFVGTWKFLSSENLDELMIELGISPMLRKLGNTTKPKVKIERNGDEWTFTIYSPLKNSVVKCKLNEEVDEETVDGRKFKTTYIYEEPKLVQTQRDKDKNVVCTITSEITPNDELRAVIKAGNVEAIRLYARDQ